MEKIEFYSKEGELVSEIPISRELCGELLSLPEREALVEVALNLSLLLKKEYGLEVSPPGILKELDRVVICGKEIKVEGGNPA